MGNLKKVSELDEASAIHPSDEFVIVDYSLSQKNSRKVTVSTFGDELNQVVSGLKGIQGAPGPQGDRGRQGATGDYGDFGDTGEGGEKGIKGNRGPRGEDGDRGPKGSVGLSGAGGLSGIKGFPGAPGDLGYIGQKGNQGTKGIPGQPGDAGLTGLQGPAGNEGPAGEQLTTSAPKGDKGDTGQPGTFGLRGERGPTGDTGHQGNVGPRGQSGDNASLAGKLNHALYGALTIRNWERIDITPHEYIHLSHFKNGNSVSYKFIRLVLEVIAHDNILQPSSPLVMNLMIPGAVSNFVPIVYGQPPVIWIKSAADNNNSIESRSTLRTPRTPVLETHPQGSHIGVYIPTHNTQFINDFKINLRIIEMYGTNSI